MTRFSTVLRAAISTSGMTQDELVGRMKKGSQGSLSRLLKGDSLPRKEMLDEICQQFAANERGHLVAAYFSDLTPQSAEDLVSVGVVQEGRDSTAARYPVNRAAPTSTLRRNLDLLERHALHDVNLANVLDQLAAMIDSRPGGDIASIREDPAYIAARKELSDYKSGRGKKK